MQFEECLEKATLSNEDAIRGVTGKSPEEMSAVLIYILDACSLL
jgi:hypothetical protein